MTKANMKLEHALLIRRPKLWTRPQSDLESFIDVVSTTGDLDAIRAHVFFLQGARREELRQMAEDEEAEANRVDPEYGLGRTNEARLRWAGEARTTYEIIHREVSEWRDENGNEVVW